VTDSQQVSPTRLPREVATPQPYRSSPARPGLNELRPRRTRSDGPARAEVPGLPGHYRSGFAELRWVPLFLLLSDVVGLVAATVLSGSTVPVAIAFGVLFLTGRAALRQYRRRLRLSVLDELPAVMTSGLIGLGMITTFGPLAGIDVGKSASRSTLFVLGGLAVLLSVMLQTVVMGVARRQRRRRGPQERTLLVGAGRVGSGLAHTLLAHPELGLKPIGFADPDALTRSEDLLLPLVSTDLGELSATLAETRATTVIIAFSLAREAQVVDMVITAHRSGCAVLIVPRMYELHHDGRDVERVRGIPLIRLRPDPTLNPTWWLKRALDVIIGSICLLLLSPLLALIAVAVLVESGRPVLFWQERVGLDGRLFRLCKFRSLRPVDEQESQTTWSIASDDRVGKVGRFLRRTSLDELAQLWNIVRSDMSLVGPRPERPNFVGTFSAQHDRYWARHRVPVGLTGLAQVNGLRGDTSIAERARYDNYYIANWSLWLDLKIVLLTVREIIRGGGR
jgi:exopolysaccharide biosynthesis polyprenyl glycosylphosphotransferase